MFVLHGIVPDKKHIDVGVINLRLLKCITYFLLGVIILGLGLYCAFNSQWVQKKFFYPFSYQDIIYTYSAKYEINPYLVAGIIRNESKFVPRARSPKGAIGLMQLMPETAHWVASQTKQPDFKDEDLEVPEINIRLGTWYLAELEDEFGGNEVLMLAAYNGGRGNVKKWMKQYGWTFTFKEIEQIPFKETREYVRKVLRDKQHYQELYGQ